MEPEENEDELASDEQEGPLPAETFFTSRLLGTDGWSGGGASVTGYVLNVDGTPMSGVAVNMLAGEELVAQIVSGTTGQFDFNSIDPARMTRWQLVLADYPNAPALVLDAETGFRYMVEFQAKGQESGSSDAGE